MPIKNKAIYKETEMRVQATTHNEPSWISPSGNKCSIWTKEDKLCVKFDAFFANDGYNNQLYSGSFLPYLEYVGTGDYAFETTVHYMLNFEARFDQYDAYALYTHDGWTCIALPQSGKLFADPEHEKLVIWDDVENVSNYVAPAHMHLLLESDANGKCIAGYWRQLWTDQTSNSEEVAYDAAVPAGCGSPNAKANSYTVERIKKAAASYIDHNSDFYYGWMGAFYDNFNPPAATEDPSRKYMNCSSLATLVALGITYENSPYNHPGELRTDPSVSSCTDKFLNCMVYDVSEASQDGAFEYHRDHYGDMENGNSSALRKMFNQYGWTVPFEDQRDKLSTIIQPGDILSFKWDETTEPVKAKWKYGASHTAVALEWLTPDTLLTVEMGGSTSQPLIGPRYLSRGIDSTVSASFNLEGLCEISRPMYVNSPTSNDVLCSFDEISTPTTATYASKVLPVKLKKNQMVTLCADIYDLEKNYLALRGYKESTGTWTSIPYPYSNNSTTRRSSRDYAKSFVGAIVVDDDYDAFAIYVFRNDGGYFQSTDYVKYVTLYNGFVEVNRPEVSSEHNLTVETLYSDTITTKDLSGSITESGFSINTGWGGCYYTKCNHMGVVHLSLNLDTATVAASTIYTLFTLPSGMRPLSSLAYMSNNTSGDLATANVQILNDGRVRVKTGTTVPSAVICDMTYMTLT